jgi:hypothetical protein
MFMNNSARIKQYSKVSTSLACFSNAQLKQILADAKPMHEGIGGKSCLCVNQHSKLTPIQHPKLTLNSCPKSFLFIQLD